jgi:hypothetical protein
MKSEYKMSKKRTRFCEVCWYTDPCDGEETHWFDLITQQPTMCLCSYGVKDVIATPEEGKLVPRTGICPHFKYYEILTERGWVPDKKGSKDV